MDGNRMWNCPGCDEPIEGCFEVCWNCGTSQEGKSDVGFATADTVTGVELAALPKIDDAAVMSPQDDSCELGVKRPRFGLRTIFLVFIVIQVLFATDAWRRRPKTSYDFFSRGMAHLDRDEFQEALVDLDRAVDILDDGSNDLNCSSTLAARALAHNNLGHYQAAIDDVTALLQKTSGAPPGIAGLLSPSPGGAPATAPQWFVSEWLIIRAGSYLGLHEYGNATKDLELVLAHHPTNREALKLLEYAKQHQNADK